MNQLRSLPEPELAFNYLGQFDQSFADSGLFKLAGESAGPSLSPNARRSNALDLVSLVVDGRLTVRWVYSRNLYRRETIDQIAQSYVCALRDITVHCLLPSAGGHTPSDFALAGLSQDQLDELLSELDKPR